MAGGQERVLRRRIRSVQSTKKITRAMELIAASRIVRARQAITAARPYVEKMAEVVADLADTPDASTHPMFRRPDSTARAALVVITGDRGLAGAYNTSVLRAAERRAAEHRGRGAEVMLVTTGRKAESYFRFRNQPVAESVTGVSDRPGFDDARRVVAAVMEAFTAGEVDQVDLVYTRFVSMGTQTVTTRQLVPLEDRAEEGARGGEDDHHRVAYEYEPDPREILDQLLPRWLEAEVFAALLEAAASEHAARQRAMKAATDNADELTKTLSRVMNRARQDTITSEIMEIVGGAEALRQSSDGGGTFNEIYVPPDAESA
ncbi:MAG TPA: F0F1 ATP synthase subunit gamma [Acidimicrobiales bacterium]|jgi:F-type H+-transporting ATPase subunit gamma|nr:F0F1 ATP synthase subunit gamma [Acidimicrobiales bacterium]